MKRVIFTFISFCCSLFAFSQSDNINPENRLKFGFSVIANSSHVYEGNPLSTSTAVYSTNGIALGIIADYRIAKHFSFSPKAELSYNRSELFEVAVMPVSLEFMGHAVFDLKYKQFNPYLLIGPNVKIPVFNENRLATHSDIAIDFGIGLNKVFSNFNFAPELRYSYGLLNISEVSDFPDVRLHKISLAFNFKK